MQRTPRWRISLEAMDIERAIERLPEDLRIVAQLVYEGWTQREIAQRLGLMVSTVNKHWQNARKRLRILLE